MRPKYEIWLTSYENKKRLQVPVNPPNINISSGSSNTTVDVAGIGEVTILQEPLAKTFEFDSQFPLTYAPFCEYINIPTPWEAVAFIEKYKSDQPFRFIITNTPINILVSVEDFSYEERAGDVGTLYYSLKLKEYRIVKPRKINVSTTNKVTLKSTPRAYTKVTPKTYTVVKGDYLIKIAKKLGISDWRTIYTANKDKIKNPNVIYVGQVLIIP
jgi:nucleoid-associated protein YgaU